MNLKSQNLPNNILAKYFNTKHPKTPIVYNGRALRGSNEKIPIDVRCFITFSDEIVINFLKDNNFDFDAPNDEKAHQCQKIVCEKFTYISDERNQGVDEYWQFPFETIATINETKSRISGPGIGYGDCEDLNSLLASLMINGGIPNFRVRVTAGLVLTHSITAPTGGHAWGSYIRESDNQCTILDTCYLPDNDIPVSQKPIQNDNPNYKEVWFSFNDTHSWSHKNYIFDDLDDLIEEN